MRKYKRVMAQMLTNL